MGLNPEPDQGSRWEWVGLMVLAGVVLGSLVYGAYHGYQKADSFVGFVAGATIYSFIGAWKIVNWPTNFMFGSNWFDLLFDAMMLGAFILLMSVVLAGPVHLVLRLFRRKLNWEYLMVAMLLMFVPPHLYMSWQLREAKSAFKSAAMGYATEDFSGVEPGESGSLNYGGSLDSLVGYRVETLTKHQYIPYFTAHWYTNGLTSWVGGAYIYTYLPPSWYAKSLLWIAGPLMDKPMTAEQKDATIRAYERWIVNQGSWEERRNDVFLPTTALAAKPLTPQTQFARPATKVPAVKARSKSASAKKKVAPAKKKPVKKSPPKKKSDNRRRR